MSADELVFRFKRSGELNKLADSLLRRAEEGGATEELKTAVKSLILSDLAANPGLLASLAQTQDRTVDQRRVASMFERRVKSEIESGLTGKPLDDYLVAVHEQVLTDVKARLRNVQ